MSLVIRFAMHTVLFRLLAILRAEPTDASALIGRLRSLTPGKVPSLPAFYRHLRRGMEEGWIMVDGTDPPGGGPGRPRQVYRLTRAGRAALAEHAREMQIFAALALDGEGTTAP
jgi:DNA-binding PadR family transcriptional regulator